MSDSLATNATDDDLEQIVAKKEAHVIEGEIEYLKFQRMHVLELSKYPPGEDVVQKVCELLKSEMAYQKESRKRSGEEQKGEKDMALMCLTEGKAKLADRPNFTATRAKAYYEPVKEKLVMRGIIGAGD
ncbi:MAG: hypothetical protein OHK93_001328 [Ramalina farinacea]|uniref:Uncharacterized protein n=1 Tax=Ramalina farinacea TaxID=258253 RepID=A0AA43TW44_9LECA|nr:hypothetical protein [Ramalina farinacea]